MRYGVPNLRGDLDTEPEPTSYPSSSGLSIPAVVNSPPPSAWQSFTATATNAATQATSAAAAKATQAAMARIGKSKKTPLPSPINSNTKAPQGFLTAHGITGNMKYGVYAGAGLIGFLILKSLAD